MVRTWLPIEQLPSLWRGDLATFGKSQGTLWTSERVDGPKANMGRANLGRVRPNPYPFPPDPFRPTQRLPASAFNGSPTTPLDTPEVWV